MITGYFKISVFDDGDERTLRRTMLCLKGEKHFVESEVSFIKKFHPTDQYQENKNKIVSNESLQNHSMFHFFLGPVNCLYY